MTMPIALPFGLRQVKITPYTDLTATTLAASSILLPNSRTLSFAEAEEFEELRGDDSLVATHGGGPQVTWSLEAGGYSFEAVQAMYGGTITSTGSAPNRVKKFAKLQTDQRPYFKIEGQVISDSGGDLHCVIFRARATDDFAGEFGDGQFFLTGSGGSGLKCLIAGADLGKVYEFTQNETITAIP